jgi:chemotaxis methyl-accepting protein methylase
MALARDILDGLERCLHAHAGFDLPEWVVETRALARMSALGLDARAYLDLIRSPRGAAELRALVEVVRVGETSFFRHRPQVSALLDVVIPAWRERGERSPRVWSAGCATGEEAYTLALVLARALPRPAFAPSILATDVSAEALATARRAIYPASALEEVPEAWRTGLIREGDSVRVRPEVAGLVTFKQQNLADANLPGGFDLVWCRNVLIYFGPEARRRVLEKVVLALQPGGFLFVGYSETLRDVTGLSAIRCADQVLWQKASPEAKGRAPSRPDLGTARARPSVPPPMRTSDPGAPPAALKTPAMRPPPPVGSKTPSMRPPPPASPLDQQWGLGPDKPGSAPIPPARPAAQTSMRITAADPAGVAAEIRQALRAPGLTTLTIDLDAADYIDDEIAPVLKRACAAAGSVGIELLLRATRPGPARWLRRNGLARGDE